MRSIYLLGCLWVVTVTACVQKQGPSAAFNLSPDSARAIAKQAWIYGYPMFYNYKSIYLYALDKSYPDNAGGFNRFKNYAKIFTPSDTSVVTPNDDTPYSWAILNLSTEPVVIVVPPIDNKRYFVMQLVDLYSYNFAYIGTRSTGDGGGKYLIAGPDWNGAKPAGIDSVFHCETNLVTVLGRTQLFSASDMVNVVRVQSGYHLEPLSTFLKTSAPAPKKYNLDLPAWNESDYSSTSFIGVLNALLQYTSVDSSETALRESFAKIGILPGKPFDSTQYSPEVLAAIRQGIQDGKDALEKSKSVTVSSLGLFGTRQELGNDYVKRATAAAMGLFGNSAVEAYYTGSMLDRTGKPLNGENKYVVHFAKDQIPPVNYFWSITMYNLPQRYLVANPINRYSIGDRTPGLHYESNGDLMIYLQATDPGGKKTANWLPSPASGPYNFVVRLYGPKAAVTDGSWKLPLPELVN